MNIRSRTSIPTARTQCPLNVPKAHSVKRFGTYRKKNLLCVKTAYGLSFPFYWTRKALCVKSEEWKVISEKWCWYFHVRKRENEVYWFTQIAQILRRERISFYSAHSAWVFMRHPLSFWSSSWKVEDGRRSAIFPSRALINAFMSVRRLSIERTTI